MCNNFAKFNPKRQNFRILIINVHPILIAELIAMNIDELAISSLQNNIWIIILNKRSFLLGSIHSGPHPHFMAKANDGRTNDDNNRYYSFHLDCLPRSSFVGKPKQRNETKSSRNEAWTQTVSAGRRSTSAPMPTTLTKRAPYAFGERCRAAKRRAPDRRRPAAFAAGRARGVRFSPSGPGFPRGPFS